MTRPETARSQARAEPRVSVIPFSASLLPTGSPFGWDARDRSLYVQFLDGLLKASDRAMYAAKANGRNRIETADG